MKFKLNPGINRCTNEQYHSDTRYLSSSSLKLILKDREKFYDEIVKGNRVSKVSPAFDEGSYAHTLILEPAMVEKEYAFFNGWRKSGSEWEKFKEQNKDLIILSKPQKSRVEKWVDSYKQLPAAAGLIQGGFSEHTIAGSISEVPIKVRADYINVDKGYIADVKTTSYPPDIDSFRLVVDQFRYQLSAALYCMMFKQYYKKDFDFYFIVLGKKEVRTEVFKASGELLSSGEIEVMNALNVYKTCMRKNEWTNSPKSDNVNFDDYEILEI